MKSPTICCHAVKRVRINLMLEFFTLSFYLVIDDGVGNECGTITENNGYIENPGYPSGSSTGSCTFNMWQ